ncbi:hypothetical protein A2313_03685 [Candidatus Roizmanbacteria bacterium RIFOXYB2_FULL_41_10]|uniref:Uncharacterized protein n=1 Tax=Candidatus Roizmanbacteria bacterium RIFOXYA1_FULL_41_12 TaxID=1802082 RepID=A0A1F7KEL7_9BACT|nr:MAG: hypothetical protein A2209_01985 [Candidatus Roizmanbacteria bacterium RIFOXYA1_FULL_41_12]OGK66649.1 MAG: hypothetical protein A2262_01595 [Candidatus Roizmanbacteria bacterium RIFOXYA2_FULL_41_8]OGK67107.1 MAG: hypothetical protein A2377_00370 [Candidatus Roizmanbacteria bacterium RIFOXYB1_FULL_41_27]OGK69032.1 MAG: hypothetical protein A2313_03685 [Candidatus Roizmanbacteria bacterium RIFOXYB2_FULL_41_10]OGK71511.1 MAG: hypothetical protein A2403_00710 [Candidatus Roizmanbacteria bac
MSKPKSELIKLIIKKLRYYFLALIVFIILMILATLWLINKINQTKIEIEKLQSLSLVNLDQVDHEAVLELSANASKLGTFLPDEFNYYQVIGLIDQISKKTRFSIQSYDLKYHEIQPDSLELQSLNLVGTGTLEQFMAFLKEYKSITGKLLTIDSVNLSGEKRVLTNLEVNIYAYKPNIELQNEPIRPLDKTDQLILEQIKRYYTPIESTEVGEDYENKGNPFD